MWCDSSPEVVLFQEGTVMRRWDGLVDSYVKECEVRGLAHSTVNVRRRELDRCGTWLKHRRPRVNLEQLDSELVIRYLRARGAFRSKSVISGAVSILRGMGEHLIMQGVWTKNPLRWIKGPKMDPRSKLPRRVGKEDMKRLWEAAEKKPERSRMLTLCVLGILYGTGLRRGELHRLDIADWDRENGILKVDGRKTGWERNVPVGPGVWRCVEAYLPVRQNRLEAANKLNETAFLIDRRGNRMTGDSISRLVQGCARAAGIPFVSLHEFRHSCVSDLLESGVLLADIQAMIGHAAIQSTMRYLDVSSGERTEAIKRHPINDFLQVSEEPCERRMSI